MIRGSAEWGYYCAPLKQIKNEHTHRVFAKLHSSSKKASPKHQKHIKKHAEAAGAFSRSKCKCSFVLLFVSLFVKCKQTFIYFSKKKKDFIKKRMNE